MIRDSSVKCNYFSPLLKPAIKHVFDTDNFFKTTAEHRILSRYIFKKDFRIYEGPLCVSGEKF